MTNRPNRWLLIALVISVSLNLLVAGFVAGHHLAGPPPGMVINPMFGLRQFADTLPDARRMELLEDLRALRPLGRPDGRDMRALQEQLRAQIRRDPIDPVALKAALAALHTHLQTHQAASQDAFVQLMQRLTPEERIALDNLQRRHLWGPRHGHDHPSRAASPVPTTEEEASAPEDVQEDAQEVAPARGLAAPE